MPHCWVPQCSNNKITHPELSFFKFPGPEKPQLRKKWLDLIRRKDCEPTAHSRICSWHFPNGCEGGPTRFQWNIEKQLEFTDPEPKRRRKRMKTATSDSPTAANACSSCEALHVETAKLKEQLEQQVMVIGKLKMQTKLQMYSSNNELILMYTGLKLCVVTTLSKLLTRFDLQYHQGWTSQLPMEDQVFLTLMKLRLDTPMLDIATRFGISRTAASNIFVTISSALHSLLFKHAMSKVPSLKKVQACIPECFKGFSSCRLVFDCTEVEIEIPRSDLEAQRSTYSAYKSRNTFKALVAVIPNGVIVYSSELFSGNTSDKEIVIQCGVLDCCEVGDMIMADKGFLIRDILPPGVSLNIPTFLDSTSRQFTESQVLYSRSVARARIHVERAIQRIKEYNILLCISSHHREHANKIFQLCCALVNLQNPILAQTVPLLQTA